ncbi:LIRP [Aphis gossypii]|uniref:LIRP n=1 Tax=Aphis gossypii TaxID=80765 RepID=UPI00100E69AB|nr:LIRP [Aphis gossypii]
MKISVHLSILLLTLVIKIVIANANLQLPSRQYCGSSLANIMQIVCKNKYNGPSHGKKRNEIDSDVLDYKDLEDYNAIDYPYQSRQEAMLFMPTRIVRSSKRTIIDECCRRPCLISELKSYCANQD